jgi:putative endonuclease
MPIFSRMIFGAVQWAARKGLRDERDDSCEEESAALGESDDEIDDTQTLGGAHEGDDAQVDHAQQLEDAMRTAARQEGVRGETYAYWYLRSAGYIFIARNFLPRAAKGEIDLIGYDGETLAFVEVRTRTVRDGDLSGLPELSVTTDKQRTVIRTALRFLGERQIPECPCRFDVVAIDNRLGEPPELRLHKDAFSAHLSGW